MTRHTPFAGSANIQGGVTVDTSGLNQVTVALDKKSVSVGPGNRWGEVYSKLDALGLSTSGGRVASVGVGGLTLGGGISFFSPRYGLVCDNILNYEIVLSSSRIVNANATSNPDLFRALKGGSSNFGIVTRFDLKTFSQVKFWGGFSVTPIQSTPLFIPAFVNFTKSKTYDPYSALIGSFTYSPARGGWSIASNLEYTKPTPTPPVFKPFTSLPQIASTLRISNLTDFTQELAAPSPLGLRDTFTTATFKNSAAMMQKWVDLANTTALSLSNVKNLSFSLSFQPLPQAVTSPGFATTDGKGNVLGLSTADGDLVNVLLTVQWTDSTDDAAIDKATRSLFADAETASRNLGTYHPYLYLNYAAPWQDPIKGYGDASVAFLKQVSRKYDPGQVFQKLVPGGFKLDGGAKSSASAGAAAQYAGGAGDGRKSAFHAGGDGKVR